MTGDDDADRTIGRLKAAAGVELDRDLAVRLGVDPSAISAWRKRGRVPDKYRHRLARLADEQESDDPVGPSYVALKNGYIFSLIGLAARHLDRRFAMDAEDEAHDVWFGFRLYKLHGALEHAFAELPARDKDALRKTYNTLHRRIAEGDVVGWIESLPNP
jgi:transcriptional regulator with XRE-family HTH domain